MLRYVREKYDLIILVTIMICLCPGLFAQIQQQWVKRYNGPGINKTDFANAICTDGDGNVYVTGGVSGYGDNIDYGTVKYNSQGVMQWIAKYHDNTYIQNFASAITVDSLGNVYVTGSSTDGMGQLKNFVTIKYNSSGVQQWMARYSGPQNNDYAVAVKVDDSGNVYVTGVSYDVLFDFATIKYNSSGVQQWIKRWNGPGNNADMPTGLALDNSGNVYVTGSTIDGNVTSYATVSYSPSGAQRWASIYNPSDNNTSMANAIAIDNQGFVYVTGKSHGSSDLYNKIATIKYDPSTGDTIWVTRYSSGSNTQNEGYGIAVDNSNDVYVSGAVNDPNNYNWGVADIKYSSAGVQQWAAVYTDPGHQIEIGGKIAVDTSGNSYIQGYSQTGLLDPEDYLVAKFDKDGAFQWINYYNGPGQDRDVSYDIATDNSGNVFVTGFSYAGHTNGMTDYATIKYNSAGTEQWTARYNNPLNGDDFVSAMKMDKLNNTYLAGTSSQQASGADIFLIKYNSNGDSLWAKSWDGPSNKFDKANSIDIDTSGNIYVVGTTWAPDPKHTHWVTLKYNSSGELLWSSLYPDGVGGGLLNGAYSVATDQSGNVYVFGLEAYLNQFSGHYLLIKYDANGSVVWTAAGPGNSVGNNAVKVVTDQNGFIYVTSRNFSNINTLKFDASGNQLWSAEYDGSGNADTPSDLFVDDSGNVYVTGATMQSSGEDSWDYVTIKYNSDGAQQWVNTYNGPGNNYDGANALTVDSEGNVIVTGISKGSSVYDYATIKYNSSGSEIWIKRYDGSGNALNFGTSVKTDQNGNAFIAGGTGSSGLLNFGFQALNSAATQQWTAEYTTGDDSMYTRPLLAIGKDGTINVAGSTRQNGTDYDFVLIKYSATVQGVKGEIAGPSEFALSQNFPDPFNPATTINYSLLNDGMTTLKVYDVLGKEVFTLVNENQKAGLHTVKFNGLNLPSGVYIYRLTSGKNTLSRKMIMLK